MNTTGTATNEAIGVAAQGGEPRTESRPRPLKRVRLALVIDSIDAWETGTERHIQRLIRVLDPGLFEPELYFLRPSTGLATFPCRTYLAGSQPSVKWYRPEALVKLVQLFRERRPQIVQTFFRDSTYYGITAARIAGVPARVISVRNTGYWMSSSDRVMSRMLGRWAVAWQCNSKSASEWLQTTQRVPPERISVLPNAIDLSRVSPGTPEKRRWARSELGLAQDALVVVSIASLRPVKDLPTLIEAAGIVAPEVPEAQFLLLGEGPDRATLADQIARLGLVDKVRLVGSQSDVRPYLAAADLAVLTSTSEASSNAVLEYAAAGLPAVLSDIPANRELADEVFFSPGNARQLAGHIVALWRDPVRRSKMSSVYRQRALQYDLGAFATQAQEYYLRLAEAYS